MAVKKYDINGLEWTAISRPGIKISCWMNEQRVNASGTMDIRINSLEYKQNEELDLEHSKRLHESEILQLAPNKAGTVFYARCADVTGTATINVSEDGFNELRKLDVSIQDASNLVVSTHMITEQSSGTLAQAATVNTYQVVLLPGHGFVDGVAGQMLAIPGYYIGEVKTVSVNTLTLDLPLSYTFPAGTTVLRGNEYLNKDGSSTPVLYGIRAIPGRKFDIEGFHMTFISSAAMDDSLFASLAELSNGLMCRVKKSATQYNLLFNAKSNQDMKLYGEIEYASKAPSGKYGMTFSMKLKEHYGVVVRLDGDFDQQLEIWVRDNLSTLGEIECIVHGHVVEE